MHFVACSVFQDFDAKNKTRKRQKTCKRKLVDCNFEGSSPLSIETSMEIQQIILAKIEFGYRRNFINCLSWAKLVYHVSDARMRIGTEVTNFFSKNRILSVKTFIKDIKQLVLEECRFEHRKLDQLLLWKNQPIRLPIP